MTQSQFPQPPPDGLAPMDYIGQALEAYGAKGEAPYRWAVNPDPVPLTPLRRPLAQARIALLSTGGAYRRGQIAFHYRNDTSFRRIGLETPADEIGIAHFGYDIRPARRDPNVILPRRALRMLADSAEVGTPGPYALTFMGGIYSQRRVHTELLPALRAALAEMAPDAVLIVPACPICHQTAGLLARRLEADGLPTVTLSSAFSVTARVHPPRTAYVDYPLGHTAGRPDAAAEQRAIVRAALSLLESAQTSGKIRVLDVRWPGDWKACDPAHDYAWPPRSDRPQYSRETDRDAAIARYGEARACGTDPTRTAPPD